MPFKPGTQGHRSPRLQQQVWQAVAARLAEQGCDGDQRAQRRLTPRPVFQSASPAPSPPLPDRPCDTAESASKACSQPRRAPARALLLTSTGSPGPGAVLPSPAPQACVGAGGGVWLLSTCAIPMCFCHLTAGLGGRAPSGHRIVLGGRCPR